MLTAIMRTNTTDPTTIPIIAPTLKALVVLTAGSIVFLVGETDGDIFIVGETDGDTDNLAVVGLTVVGDEVGVAVPVIICTITGG